MKMLTLGNALGRLFCVTAVFLVIASSGICQSSPVPAENHSAAQLASFARSRPGVGEVLTEGQDVYRFLIDAFAGKYTSVPLAWDAREPNDNAYAEHKPSVNRKVIDVRVSAKLSPLDQVACLVYESINAQNEKKFTEITEQAHKGILTKSEFIKSILRLEHASLKRTRNFLSQEMPFKTADSSKTLFFRKMNGTPEKFDDFIEYLHTIKRKDYDVFEHYSNFYDFVIPRARLLQSREEETATDQEKTGDNDGETIR